MQTKNIPFGTKLKATVLQSDRAKLPGGRIAQVTTLRDENGEGQILIGDKSGAEPGDTGTMEFMPGGQHGGHWQFTVERKAKLVEFVGDGRKPWPSDAIMIVCATPELANRAAMEGAEPCNCRDCNQPLVVDTRTLRRAKEIATKGSDQRPIKFFCEECYLGYDVSTCSKLVDHSRGKSIEYGRTGEPRVFVEQPRST